jgi:hypothetical protein
MTEEVMEFQVKSHVAGPHGRSNNTSLKKHHYPFLIFDLPAACPVAKRSPCEIPLAGAFGIQLLQRLQILNEACGSLPN